MTAQDRYNSEQYLDTTAYLAMRHIEKRERTQRKLREDWDFRRGDLYLADLGYGAVGFHGNPIPGGIRPVVLLQNNLGTIYAPTLVAVPISSKIWVEADNPTHYRIQDTKGLRSAGTALGEQIITIHKRQCLRYLGRLEQQSFSPPPPFYRRDILAKRPLPCYTSPAKETKGTHSEGGYKKRRLISHEDNQARK